MPAIATQPPARATALRLPTYALYGEHGQAEGTDWLHCESIADRSRHHQWEIRPHRHELLLQILYIRRGGVQAQIEQDRHALIGPCALVVPAVMAHGFRFSTDVDGSVVTVLEPHLVGLLRNAASLGAWLAEPRCLQWAPRDPIARQLDAAVTSLRREFTGAGAWRDLGIDAALLQLLLLLGRSAPPVEPADAGTAVGDRAQAHVRRLRALVDLSFRAQPTLAGLARELGITPTQLNRVCQQVLGHSALGVLHGRLLLEAQRDLVYTSLSVKQIGFDLGFSDPGYFTRFFTRMTGLTPTAWRQRGAAKAGGTT